MKLRVLFISMFLFVLPTVYAANKIPQFKNYPVEEIYTGKIIHWLWIRSEKVLERGYVMLLSMRNLILPVIS